MPFLFQRICSFAFLVRAKLFDSVPLRICAGQINAQLFQAVASLRIALPCTSFANPLGAERCFAMLIYAFAYPLHFQLYSAIRCRCCAS